jgi:hypothetical protein
MKQLIRISTALLGMAAISLPAHAGSVTFTSSSGGDWMAAENWTPAIIPTEADDATISLGVEFAAVTIRAGGALAKNLTLAASGSDPINYVALIFISNAASLTTGAFSIGGSSGQTSTLQFNGAGTLIADSLDLGAGESRANIIFGAPGTLTIGNGTGSITKSDIANSEILSRSPVAPTIQAASITVTTLGVGDNKGGEFNIDSGQTYHATSVNVSNSEGNDDENATLSINGGQLNTTCFNILAGTMNNEMNAVVNLNGGTLSSSLIQRVWKGASQTFNWNDGTISNEAGKDLKLKSTAGEACNLVLSLSGEGIHTFSTESYATITVESTAILADQPGQHGSLTIQGGGMVEIQSTGNTYSGKTILAGGTLFLSDGSLGTGDVDVADQAVLALGNNSALKGNGVTLSGPASRMDLNYGGNLEIKSLTLKGGPVAPGTYTAAQLDAKYGGKWFAKSTGTGTLTVNPASKTR